MKDGKEKNVIPVPTAEYKPCGWRAWLNNTTLTLGMQNVFDEDPPFVAGSFENSYDESLTTIKGRFWYVQLKKEILSCNFETATSARARRRFFGTASRKAIPPRHQF